MRRPLQVLVYVTRIGADGERQYLLLHRVARGDAFWQGVTGGAEDGETPLAAARRELNEETGFEPKRLVDLAFTYSFPVADRWRDLYAADVTEIVEHTFVAEVPGTVEPNIDPHEHDLFRWCSFDHALGLLAWPDNIAALRRAREVLEN